jgi:predicted phosphate transport protein (TIGR00153 family)
VFGRFLPRDTSFFDFFDQHAALTLEGAKQFATIAHTGANIAAGARRIREIEHEADVVTHRCVEALHKTFITPIERGDIYRLISRMDDVVDLVEATSERIALYELTVMTDELRSLADVLVQQCEQIRPALQGLRDMKNAEPVLRACLQINKLENDSDEILRAALAKLFREEQNPIAIIKWKEIYENVESATDRCEDVANTVEGIVLENA